MTAFALAVILVASIPAHAAGDSVNVTKPAGAGRADAPQEQASDKDAPADAGLDEFINAALEGYTGLINIPTAAVLPEGRARFAYTINNSLSPNGTFHGQRTINGAISLGCRCEHIPAAP